MSKASGPSTGDRGDARAGRRSRPADRGAGRSMRCREGAIVGTSSPRRAAQLLHLRPDLRIEPIRGNVQTRLDKSRGARPTRPCWPRPGSTGWGSRRARRCRSRRCCPRRARRRSGSNAAPTMPRCAPCWRRSTIQRPSRAVRIERAFTRALGGTCHSPVAALGEVTSSGVRLRAEIYERRRRGADRGGTDDRRARTRRRRWRGRCSAAPARRRAGCSRMRQAGHPAPRAGRQRDVGAGASGGARRGRDPVVRGPAGRVDRARPGDL